MPFQKQTHENRAHTPNYLLFGALTLKATISLPKSPQGQLSDN